MQAFPKRPRSLRARSNGEFTGRESVLHLRKLGIQLKSNPAWSTNLKTRPPTRSLPVQFKVRKRTPAATSLTPPLTPQSEVTFVSDLVVPLPFSPDDINLHRSATSQAFCSTSRVKQLPLLHVSEQRMSRSPGSAKSVALHGERFVPVETKDSGRLKTPVSPSFSATSNSPIWSHMTQKERIQAEQEAKERSREMKRTSEIMSHRQDRRYYMTGSQMALRGKYEFDEDELAKLRKQHTERQNSAKSRYSDAVAMLDYKPDGEHIEGGEQSTPGGHLPLVDNDRGDNVFLTNKETSDYYSHPRVGSVKRVNTPVTQISHTNKDVNSVYYINDDEEIAVKGKSGKTVHFSDNHDSFVINDDNNNSNINVNDEQVENTGVNDHEELGDTTAGTVEAGNIDSDSKQADDINSESKEADDTEQSVKILGETDKRRLERVEEAEESNDKSKEFSESNFGAAFKIDRELYQPNKEDVMNVDFSRPPEPEPEPPPEPEPVVLSLEDYMTGGSSSFDMDALNNTLKALENKLFNVDHLKGTSGWVFPEELEADDEDAEGLFGDDDDDEMTEEETKDAMTIFRKRTESLKPASDAMGLSDLYMYSFISDQQRELYTKKFRSLDTDGNGVLSMKELHQKLFINATKRDVALFMKVFDLNKDKTIDLNEFVTVAALNDRLTGHVLSSADEPLELNLPKLAYHITSYREMFELVDEDFSGKISLNEMMVILTAGMGLDVGTDKDFVEILLQTVDKDRNGYIEFVEYLTYIPFFLQIHRQLMNREVLVEDIERARLAVRQALRSKPQYESLYKKTKDIWADD